jgi:UDP-glucose 4-epimerase
MKALVIGGCGFIGSHVVDELLRVGHAVRVLDRRHERFRPPLRGVDYQIGDFRERLKVAEAITDMDAVFHLASTTFPGTANLDPRTDVSDNLIGSLGLMETMLSLQVPRLLFLSSGGTVYGVPEQVPIPETHPLRPINSYGIVKVAIEQYLEMYRRTRGLSPLIVRASNPFGPRQGHTGVQGVVSTFLSRIAAGDQIEIWGDGSVVRDFIDVRDLAEFCVVAGTSSREGVYNVGRGVGTSLNDLLDRLRAVTGKTVEPKYRPARLIDAPVSILDCTAAARDFGWKATRPLSEALDNAWKWTAAAGRAASSGDAE